MFEYLTAYKGSNDITEQNMSGYLNKMGADRWELVHVISRPFVNNPHLIANYTFIFKRRIN
jgi:hypothetical protein